MKNRYLISFLFAVAFYFSNAAYAAPGVILSPSNVITIKGSNVCGKVVNFWIPGTKLSNGEFYSYAQQGADFKKALKKAKGSKAALLKAKINKAKKALTQNKPICSILDNVVPTITPTPTSTPTVTPTVTATPTVVIPTPVASQTAAPGATTIAWNNNATSVQSHFEQTFSYYCPAAGTTQTIWGTDYYTSDSSICTAAVHRGLITVADGGNVQIKLKPGRRFYIGSIRNGVTSTSYYSYDYSYVFVVSGMEAVTGETPVIPWTENANSYAAQIGTTFPFSCPAGGPLSGVKGTDIYTTNSSICSAAVHAGKISLASGGSCTIQMTPGEASYTGSTRNGVTSDSFGVSGNSFIFVP